MSDNDVKTQYKSPQYPFNCDFYIKSIDTYIECNFHWTHGGRRYNEFDSDCKRKLSEWVEKSNESKYYQNAIYCWTDFDIRKYETALNNSLNYKVYYTLSEVKEEYGGKEN